MNLETRSVRPARRGDPRCSIARLAAMMIVLLSLGATSPVRGDVPEYSLEFLGGGLPTAMNNCGEVVGGWLGSPASAWYADRMGNVTALPAPPGAVQTKANDINEAGLIVGTATESNGTPRACMWSFVDGDWQVELLESLPVTFGSYGVAVNDLGDIVGTNIGELGSGAVLFTGEDGPIDLYPLGLTERPADINNARQVVGEQLVLDLDDLTVFDTGVPDPDPQHYLWSLAIAMNDAGQIAARVVTATSSFYPVAAKFAPETGWQVLSGPATGNTAHDINEHGDVLIFIQSSWGQQPYLHIAGVGTYRVQALLDPELEFWYIENIGATAMNDHLQLAVVVENISTGQYGTARLTPQRDPADVDSDGFVGIDDLLAVLSAWGPCTCCLEDIDGSGDVGVEDLLIVLGHWGAGG